MDRVRGTSARAFASVRVCLRAPEALCRWDWRRRESRLVSWPFRVAGVGYRGHVCMSLAFRVAGVGNGGHRRCRERGFAWQPYGIVRAACVSRGTRGEWCDQARCPASFCVGGAGNRANHARQLKPVDFVALGERCVRRGAVLGGARNPWICGRKLGADASQNAVARSRNWRGARRCVARDAVRSCSQGRV